MTPQVERLLGPAHGSIDRARAAAVEYRSGRWKLYGWFEAAELIACVGFEARPDSAVIRSLAVDEHHRNRGVGRKMVEAALAKLEPSRVEAETDSEAVGFYRSLGFFTTSLGAKYPGVERFRCVRVSSR
jgi:ribosomal protein S18 acetylase RimI-like enzyme